MRVRLLSCFIVICCLCFFSNEASAQSITATGSISGLITTYGTASASRSFLLSGTNLQGPVTVAAPAGFELSTDNISYAASLNLPNSGSINTIVYVRLARTANAKLYTDKIVITSPGAANAEVDITNCTVNPSPMTITGNWVKSYGDVLPSRITIYYNSPGVTFSNLGLKNGDSFNSLDIDFTVGTTATATAGVYTNTVTMSNFTGRTGFLSSNYAITYQPVTLIVQSAALTIKADKVTKPFGTTLTSSTATTGYAVTGLKNNETLGSVNLAYGAGAAANAAPGVYAGAVTASGAAGGTFTPTNYNITYVANDIEVSPPPPPLISYVNNLQSLNTVYGTASGTTNFSLSAANLTAGVTITLPSGFEGSTDNVNFNSVVTIPSVTNIIAMPVYIRLAARTNVGQYNGDIVVSSSSVTSALSMPVSTVSPAPLTITANFENKTYGDELADGPAGVKFIITGGSLKNGNILTGATYTYGQGKAVTDVVGIYANTITVSNVTGANGFLPANYNINYIKAGINVTPASLVIKAANNTKWYGSTIVGAQAFTATGLKNGDVIMSVEYNYTDGRSVTSNAGLYSSSIVPFNAVGTYSVSNYNLSYESGDLMVLPRPLVITALNATRNYGEPNPAFAVTYSGFVNSEDQSQLTKLPVVTTTATTVSNGGVYPIVPSGASALNYSIGYVNGELTVVPPVTLVIPNTFTPNNDGVNDTWRIPALASYPNCIVQVFNRYGASIYSSKGYATEWDGTLNGKALPVGVYYYLIDTKLVGIKAAGTITIIR